jgi:hypothetical protein
VLRTMDRGGGGPSLCRASLASGYESSAGSGGDFFGTKELEAFGDVDFLDHQIGGSHGALHLFFEYGLGELLKTTL